MSKNRLTFKKVAEKNDYHLEQTMLFILKKARLYEIRFFSFFISLIVKWHYIIGRDGKNINVFNFKASFSLYRSDKFFTFIAFLKNSIFNSRICWSWPIERYCK